MRKVWIILTDLNVPNALFGLFAIVLQVKPFNNNIFYLASATCHHIYEHGQSVSNSCLNPLLFNEPLEALNMLIGRCLCLGQGVRLPYLVALGFSPLMVGK